ncbi:aspartyl/asparaginyl beta-hydroxylase domain-containing protein [Thalassotalea euphylliae]|uniref:aspartyl/asparaginyl beta-hydroxylase domain-containing protein n=1 Tax=Thalassotalea euphylliae TaxID=1655234 RepID=UPI0036345749
MTDLKHIDALFNDGKNDAGFRALQAYTAENQHDLSQLYRFAVLAEQLGTKVEASNAWDTCLKHLDANVLVYLYAGCFFFKVGDTPKATAILSLGQDKDPRLIHFYRDEKLESQTRERSYRANQILRKHFSELHRITVGEEPSRHSIYKAIWPQTHDEVFHYQHKQQLPNVLYIPHLKAQPYWSAEAFGGEYVEQNFDVIRREFLSLTERDYLSGEPYLESGFTSRNFEKLAGSLNWTALHLFKNGIENKVLTSKFEKTIGILKRLPLYGLNENPYEVFLSVLKPGQHIAPHYGPSNHSLTIHLPLVIPGEGYLRVGEEKKTWKEGKLVAFDDSFEHEAINQSSKDRVVLIFSIWHPELSSEERKAIQETFNARLLWLEGRQGYLCNL